MKLKHSHFLHFRVQNSKGTIVTYGGYHGGTGKEEKKELEILQRSNVRANYNMPGL